MNKAQAERVKRIQEALLPLRSDTRFQHFIEEIRQQQRAAIADACSERVVASQRLSMACIGEVRTYDSILSFYDSQVEQAESTQQE